MVISLVAALAAMWSTSTDRLSALVSMLAVLVYRCKKRTEKGCESQALCPLKNYPPLRSMISMSQCLVSLDLNDLNV